ncbi:MAG: hypothetical protein PF690_02600 [Deltaproteobacteria bacterium]|jgi:hypothetical protein|nr:hypothetical protein [Deltaproteobacteria bacterium]
MTDLNDDIIELTDIANKNSDLPTGEYVIELTDIVKDEITNLDLEIEKEDEFELEISASKDAEQIDDEFTDDIFEDDDVEDNSYDDGLTDDEFPDVELSDVDQAYDDWEDDTEDITVDKPETEPDLDKVVPDSFIIDQEQIETVLERIIEKKFAGKIESILFEVMENVIEKQIVEIKESLQKDLE